MRGDAERGIWSAGVLCEGEGSGVLGCVLCLEEEALGIHRGVEGVRCMGRE